MKPIIEVNHVWKEYQKGIDRKYKSLRDTIAGMPEKWLGKEKEKFWALEDIDFKVEAGESVGIIGHNGAGKSTLLKILSRITPPTKGEIILRGRVASLLEVGTGFHPELTGRENVFFNGSILGMKHQEIKRKFDEIVDFSGVESFIDTPLKHYSSGMQMRLAFSVAAHLDAEILLIDEVLAVGDAEFQKKCIGKMDEVSKGEGKTILFVSHNQTLINSLCPKSIMLNESKIQNIGVTSNILNYYVKSKIFLNTTFNGSLSNNFQLIQVKINELIVIENSSILLSSTLENVFSFKFLKKNFNQTFRVAFSVFYEDIRLFTQHDSEMQAIDDGVFDSIFKIPRFLLRPGKYFIGLGGYNRALNDDWFWNPSILSFVINSEWSVEQPERNFGIINVKSHGKRSFNT